MKNLKILTIGFFATLLLVACDNRTVNTEVFNLDQEIELIRSQFLLPISKRLTDTDIKKLSQYQHIDDPTEVDINELKTYIGDIISDEEFSILNKSVKRILENYPEFRQKSKNEIQESILIKLQISENHKSCEAATIAALAYIASIEATWVGAMIACAGTTFGYGLCAGIATFAKYSAIAGLLANLAAACGEVE